MLTLPPLSLYIHIPWCVRKCPYCDFNSHQSDTTLPERDYVQALAQDLLADAELAQGRKLTSIFFGGGTPSLFSAGAIGQILDHAERTLGFSDDIEITLEANPGTFEQDKFTGFRAAGVNRLSIGIQSFQDEQLQALGRIHDSHSALRAADTARRAGFDNLNLDLMHGLPGQSLSAAMDDLNTALSLEPEHLSWYQLTIEPNTVFYSQPPTLPIEDTLADIQDEGHARLEQAGFKRYEVSAYARGARAQHNLNYWQFGDYLGIGAGAHGKITQPNPGHVFRQWKTRQPEAYLSAQQGPGRYSNPFVAGREAIDPTALPLEFLLNTLRLNEGCAPELFPARTGLPSQALEPHWQGLVDKGLVHPRHLRIGTTELGMRFLNDVLGAYT
ncbi:radical SAM family heme chaperone HemW [Gilvimarinus agarilyticus]|uniref:radical SAM family heme chaperone HemW n=1 Tax=unclassified Gilvimarinus TaxID=2642066 RepID=UPI001C09B466|nr:MULTISPECIES: radical SAM family heme chaperone HemW [unclassified Gilvimarinus]MBU2884450.1 radical SAM family heme chaperone HemW [Gilvimarinus agarilyticus]MDO6569586.1 radical SAM family heme chaperone HemW [Gilvimarinus sp. 2_MG-2023]MDO6748089.1 radical SAM family heme chaperone HemW [Gilvimarinus sp. 1_MG-2023]